MDVGAPLFVTSSAFTLCSPTTDSCWFRVTSGMTATETGGCSTDGKQGQMHNIPYVLSIRTEKENQAATIKQSNA